MSDITWQEFFDMVLLEANKGDTLKEVIPGKAFQAVRSLEQNWSYKWNEKLLEFQIDQTLDNPNILELPEDFKSVITLNISTSDFSSCMDSLQALDPESFALSGGGSDAWGYWIQNVRWLWLPNGIQDKTRGFLWYNAFTLKSEMVGERTSPILKYGQEALLGLTMQNLAAFCREPSWRELYGPLTEFGIKTLHVTDAELRRATDTGTFGGLDG
jgi:hypothetical protein